MKVYTYVFKSGIIYIPARTSESAERHQSPAATNKRNLYTQASLKALKAFKIYLLGVRLFCPFSSERKFSTLASAESAPRQIKIYLIEAAGRKKCFC